MLLDLWNLEFARKPWVSDKSVRWLFLILNVRVLTEKIFFFRFWLNLDFIKSLRMSALFSSPLSIWKYCIIYNKHWPPNVKEGVSCVILYNIYLYSSHNHIVGGGLSKKGCVCVCECQYQFIVGDIFSYQNMTGQSWEKGGESSQSGRRFSLPLFLSLFLLHSLFLSSALFLLPLCLLKGQTDFWRICRRKHSMFMRCSW